MASGMSSGTGYRSFSVILNRTEGTSVPKTDTFVKHPNTASSMPLGPAGGTLGSSVHTPGLHEERTERDLELGASNWTVQTIGKEAKLGDGLCTDRKWEIEVGVQHSLRRKKKHHFWSSDKR
jgi:hypothetical protein